MFLILKEMVISKQRYINFLKLFNISLLFFLLSCTVTVEKLNNNKFKEDYNWSPPFSLDNGIISNYPPEVVERPSYPIFVSKVDEDGNELAGIRLPEVAAPVATTTGWALRRTGFSEGEGGELDGQHIPFKTTKAERTAAHDPRLSLEERYKHQGGYVTEVTRAAKKLEAQRFLLPADVQRYIKKARVSEVLPHEEISL